MPSATIMMSFSSLSVIACCCIILALLVFNKDTVCTHFPKFPLLCKQSSPSPSPPSPSNNSTPTGGDKPADTGSVTLSQYWVPAEGDSYLMDCGNSPPKKPESKSKKGKEVVLNQGAKKYELQPLKINVDGYMWDACYCEGSCHVGNYTVNLEKEGSNAKFSKTAGKTWGKGSKDNSLVPLVSVTADKQYPFGTTLYISALDGVTLASGEVHNGCVRVDDSCGDGCTKNQIDFHVGTYDNYKKIQSKLPNKVGVAKQSCTPKSYKL